MLLLLPAACVSAGDGGADDPEIPDLTPPEPNTEGFVLVPPGSFEMGCTSGQGPCDEDEFPAHEVTLTRAFWLGQTEVTASQWRSVIGNERSGHPDCGGDCPAMNLTWSDALHYANELSVAEGLPECYGLQDCYFEDDTFLDCEQFSIGELYDCVGYRLPTEAEWEYAARAGANFPWSGSSDPDEVAWYLNTSDNAPHPVALKPANAWGFHDMSGNLQEWTASREGPYADGPLTDPDWYGGGSGIVVRSGYWNDPASGVRVANRRSRNASDYGNNLGFRVARTAE